MLLLANHLCEKGITESQDGRNFGGTCAICNLHSYCNFALVLHGKMHTFSTNQTRVIFSCTLLINLPVSSCAFICLWMNLFISRSLILASCRSFQRFIIKRACLSHWYSVCQPKKSSYSVSDVRRTLNL